MNDNSKFLVEKSNTLNMIKMTKETGYMSLTEFRFFCLYLSKLNPEKPKEREVKIYIKEYETLFNTPVNMNRLTSDMLQMLKRIVKIDDGTKAIIYATLYSGFKLYNDKDYITISANADIMSYIFELQKNYTKYQLQNIVYLNTVSKIKLYEILVQYLKVGIIKFEIDNLKSMIGSNISEFALFNQKTLAPAVKDINQYTDINVTYEKITHKRKVIAIQFKIEKNKKDISKKEETAIELNIDNTANISDVPKPIYSELSTLKDLYKKYFTDEQYEQLLIMIKSHEISNPDEILKNALSALEKQMSQKKINSKIGYITNIINNMINDKLKSKSKKNQTYGINEFERFAINDKEIKESAIFKAIMDAGFINADYKTALKILKDNRQYMTLSEDKLQFIEGQMESKKQIDEMLASI